MTGLSGKVRGSIRERGVLGTLRHVGARLRARWCRYLDGRFDRAHGTDTSGIVEVRELTLAGSPADAIWYEPIPTRTVSKLLRQVPIDRARYTFVDFGSGKGRPALVASRSGFRRAVGVEFARELHETAAQNVAIFRARHPDAAPIELLCADAATYTIPEEPCLFFFFSPFRFAVMAKVLCNIREAVRRPKGGEAAILFVGLNPDTFAQMRALGWREHAVRVPRALGSHAARSALLLTHEVEGQ